jgi:hypothetical protein
LISSFWWPSPVAISQVDFLSNSPGSLPIGQDASPARSPSWSRLHVRILRVNGPFPRPRTVGFGIRAGGLGGGLGEIDLGEGFGRNRPGRRLWGESTWEKALPGEGLGAGSSHAGRRVPPAGLKAEPVSPDLDCPTDLFFRCLRSSGQPGRGPAPPGRELHGGGHCAGERNVTSSPVTVFR